MNSKQESMLLVIPLLLLAGLVCPQTAQAQIQSDVQPPSGFHLYSPQNVAVNTTVTNNTTISTAQPPEDEITKENQMPLMVVIIVAAFAAYIAVIVVLSSKKIR